MLNSIKKIKKENKGAISILIVIFIFILVIAFDGLFGISTSMSSITGLQSKLDIAGLNALYDSVDLNALKDNQLGVVDGGGIITNDGQVNQAVFEGKFKNVIKRKYEDELRRIEFPGKNMKILKTDVDFEYSNFGIGFSSSSSTARQRPQIILESIISYDVASSSAFDELDRVKGKDIKSVRSGTTINITVTDSGRDGYQTIVVHSVTRLVLK